MTEIEKIAMAVAHEREACAKIAETLAREYGSELGGPPISSPRGLPEFEQSARIASAIRSRTPSQPAVDVLTAPATGRSPISPQGSIEAAPLSEVICTVDSAEFLVDGEIEDDDDREPGVYLTLHTSEAIGIKAGRVAIRFLPSNASATADSRSAVSDGVNTKSSEVSIAPEALSEGGE